MNKNSVEFEEKYFWLQKDGRYVLKRDIFGMVGCAIHAELPMFDMKFEPYLKRLGINYEIFGNKCIIYDPQRVEWEEFTAPVREVQGISIVYFHWKREELYTGKIPTKGMMEAARLYFNKAKIKIQEEICQEEIKQFEEYFALNCKDGISCWWNQQERKEFSVHNIETKYAMINFDRTGEIFNGVVVIKEKVKPNSGITIIVPKKYVGKAVGKGGENVKELAKKLGVRYIRIEAIEES